MTVLNLQVSAGADDGYTNPNTFVASTDVYVGRVNAGRLHGWARFTGVSGLEDELITTAIYSVYKLAETGSPSSSITIYADRAESPTAPSSVADHNGKTRTSAGIQWNVAGATGTWLDSPSIVSVIQELADNFDPTAIQILHDGVGTGSGAHWVQYCAYETNSDLAPKLYIEYGSNTPPTITVNPSVNYNGYTRTGPANSPISVTFEAEDAEETGTDELTVEIRTAASGGGTLVATDDYTSGTSGSISIAHNASGLSEGSNTLYMRVGDGTDWSDDESFTLLVDRTAPDLGTVDVFPAIVTGGAS